MDQDIRERFQRELKRNFSVQAPAGTGKTTLLAGRVVELASRYPHELSSLVVVTYTDRAARQMRARILAGLHKQYAQHLPEPLRRGISRAFIGTIHSFCCSLIREHAPFLGYPGNFEVLDEVSPPPQPEPWELPPWPWVPKIHCLLPEREIRMAAQKLSRRLMDWEKVWRQFQNWLPGETWDAVALRQRIPVGYGNKGKSKAKQGPAWLHKLEQAFSRWDGQSYLRLALSDRDWEELRQNACEFVRSLEPVTRAGLMLTVWYAARLQEHRFRQGLLYYSDQILLAHRILSDPGERQKLLLRGYRVLLDEAQDTDPWQFAILTELARSPDTTPFEWLKEPEKGPGPGRFCMVGDSQQSIYRDRANLAVYLAYHQALCSQPHGEELHLRQGHRCPPALVRCLEGAFRAVLTGEKGQTSFHPVAPAPEKEEGTVLRWVVPPEEVPLGEEPKLLEEARWLARRLAQEGPQKLGASHWGQIAILAFRREELQVLAQALEEQRIPYQSHFEGSYRGTPELWWLASLATIQEEPWNEWEIAGILREVYGISDREIFEFRYPEGRLGAPRKLFLAPYPNARSRIEAALDTLYQLSVETRRYGLGKALAIWTERIGLTERLQSALGERSPAIHRRVARWILRAYREEEEGRGLASGSRLLDRVALKGTSSLLGPHESQAVQLLTTKKAKGLEWEVVILAFWGRPESFLRKDRRPHVFADCHPESLPAILWANGLWTPGGEEQPKIHRLQEEQERQRLAYVACTRARQTLIFVDDEALWKKEKERKGAKSNLDLLGPRDQWWDTLPGESRAVPLLSLEGKRLVQESVESFSPDPWPEKPGSTPSLTGWIRRLPSQEDRELEENASRGGAGSWIRWKASLGLRYGLWWHALLARWPWCATPSEREGFFREKLRTLSPALQERARKEIALFWRTDFYRRLQEAAGRDQLLVELPYVRVIQEGVVEEGKMDLLYKEKSNTWVLVDWKTDQPEEEDFRLFSQKLLGQYRSQLLSYVSSGRHYGLEIERVEIYSTPWGKVIPVPFSFP
ncbi:UvrD-helicase domain-containing protein [Candidatus Methylacidithermus pantelleriae]|uniref:DNA 3'-5' helicase n=1 Tax=Candidatus Methylacidithermus pantelleriae TaxID=2744239 RepID=A0A8J2BM48_9BACT|nr:UvrD-helicase domain-containing protein [Candidatus Methylacidithermus pantelleriae]CAF0689432.1 putative DNA helicase [Candidatus Methylacidithermus pantelleriae]